MEFIVYIFGKTLIPLHAWILLWDCNKAIKSIYNDSKAFWNVKMKGTKYQKVDTGIKLDDKLFDEWRILTIGKGRYSIWDSKSTNSKWAIVWSEYEYQLYTVLIKFWSNNFNSTHRKNCQKVLIYMMKNMSAYSIY